MAAGSASAHVQLNYPLGGETFIVGQRVKIEWRVLIPHNQENWDLYFSPDGGANWEVLELDMDPSQLDYRWTVPNITTENARIRIYMDNMQGDYEDASGDLIITDTQTSIKIQEKNPSAFTLHPNYPNPFNPTTIINYELPNTTNIDLSVYNLLGQQIVTLVSGQQTAGYHSIQWDASNLSAGAYFIKLQANDFVQIKKSVLLK